jgi:hypothetical protein
MADADKLTQLKLYLAQAEVALHTVTLGDKAETVEFGTQRRVTFTPAKVGELRRYISELKSQIAVLEGGRGRGPIYQVLC